MPLDTISTSVRTELAQLNREIELATVDPDGCPGMRPSEPADLATLECSVSQLTRDSGASPEANASLGSLATQKQSALFRNAVEATEHLEQRRPFGHGTKGFRAWWHPQSGYWLMRCSKEAAEHFWLRAMCGIAPDELQDADR